MAQKTLISDDLDRSANAETVIFGFDGEEYSIDLAKKNRAALEKALKPYLAVATKVSNRRRTAKAARAGSGRRSATGSRTRRSRGVDLAAVRAWAAEQGIEVSSRGRVARDVIDAYTANH